ncbi:maleylpyruvate isomerase family mycothiol-dependent enzyme [Parasphingorhabdus pacifica]
MSEIVLGSDNRSTFTDHSTFTQAPATTAGLAEHVQGTTCAIERATSTMMDLVEQLDENTAHLPSLLPGWTRTHVLSHLARNADGSVNLLLWARTGVEHPMYTSDSDREADIEEGALRDHRLIVEDLAASCERLAHEIRIMPLSAWTSEIVGRTGEPEPAHEVLRSRLLEVWTHLADLDHGFGFDDIPEPDVELLTEDVVQQFGGRPDVPAITVTVDFDDHRRDWELRGTTSKPVAVRGRPGPMLGWLLGRTGAERLECGGKPPTLPDWL